MNSPKYECKILDIHSNTPLSRGSDFLDPLGALKPPMLHLALLAQLRARVVASTAVWISCVTASGCDTNDACDAGSS